MARMPTDTARSIARMWIAVLMLAAVVRMAAAAWIGPVQHGDIPEYRKITERYRAEGRLCEVFSTDQCRPLVNRGPLYPLVLAALEQVTGRGSNDDREPVRRGQQLLGLLILVVPLVAGSALVSGRWAVLAGLLLALDPLSIVWANAEMSEAVFMPLFALAIACGARALSRETGSAPPAAGLVLAALAGGLAGLASLARPVGQVLVLTAAPFFVVRGLRARLVAFAAGVMLVLGPWQLRNASVGESGVPIGLGYNLLVHVSWHRLEPGLLDRDPVFAAAWARFGRRPEALCNDTVNEARRMILAAGGRQVDFEARAVRLALGAIARHPGRYLLCLGKNVLHMAADFPLGPLGGGATDVISLADARANLAAGPRPAAGVIAFWLLPPLVVVPLALAGLAAACRSGDRPLLMLAVVSVALLAFSVVLARPEARHRLPAHPALACLAAAGMRTLVERRRNAVS